jgi:hypothetical protein
LGSGATIRRGGRLDSPGGPGPARPSRFPLVVPRVGGVSGAGTGPVKGNPRAVTVCRERTTTPAPRRANPDGVVSPGGPDSAVTDSPGRAGANPGPRWRDCPTAGTAKGVVFLTLEDETGFVNDVLWPQVWTT